MAVARGKGTVRRDVLDRLGVPMPGPSADPQQVTADITFRLILLVRLFTLPVVLTTGVVGVDVHPVFWGIVALQVLWKGAGAIPAVAAHVRRIPETLTNVIDLSALGGLVLASGGADSPLRVVLVVVPFAGGFLESSRRAVGVGLAAFAVYALAALPDLLGGERVVLLDAEGIAISIAFAAVAGVAVARVRELATAQLTALNAARRRLLAVGLDAEDSERRSVSHDLHAGALQQLLAAIQDLEEDDPEAMRRARDGVRAAVAAVRDTVRDLHPTTLRHGGLEAAIRAALEHRTREVLNVLVGPDRNPGREAFLLSIVRELGDALATLGLDRGIVVEVAREGGETLLELGTRSPLEDPAAFAAALAGCTELVDADGGELRVGRDAAGGARVRVRLGAVDTPGDANAGTAGFSSRAELVFSLARLGALPFALLVAVVSGHPTLAFFVLIALATSYDAALVLIVLRLRRWRTPNTWVMGAATVASGLAITQQGDVTTPLAAAALSIPFLLVISFSPRGVALVSALAGIAVAVGFSPAVLDGAPGARAAAAVLAMAYGWAVASGIIIATGRTRLVERQAGLDEGRRRLLHSSLNAADAERRRLAETLHDHALQELMIAGQDLDEALNGDATALRTARVALRSGVFQLREALADLHPPALEHGGLRPALATVVERACSRRGITSSVVVEAGTEGLHDEFVIHLTRELVGNACKHARAHRVTVRVERVDGWLRLEVADDGVGTTHERLEQAVLDGHIGLAASRERIEVDGGRLLVSSAPGEGTVVVAELPAGALDVVA